MLSYSPTPVVAIGHASITQAGVRLLLKREDLNHADVPGNKWWKLKYNLEEAVRVGNDTLLTFGGAFSNHIHATAAAARALNLRSIGVIRGEEVLPLNRTLQSATDNGMRLHYITRQAYREKDSPSFVDKLKTAFGEFYLIPEGGTNSLALKGCEEFAKILNAIDADYICLPVGTGGTMGGLLRITSAERTVIGFPVLENGGFLEDSIRRFVGVSDKGNWRLLTEYAYGGYAKRNATVTEFIKRFRHQTGIPLDFVYTGKMMCALFDLIEKGFFKRGKTILAIHTGGLQGHSD